MEVSLVVTVRDEARTIGAFIASVLAQERPPGEFVLVDGGSIDGTLLQAARLADGMDCPFPIRLIRFWGANIARGRNVGIAASRHPIIAVSDAGCTLRPTWLRELRRAFDDPEVALVGGNYAVITRGYRDAAAAAMTIPVPENAASTLPSSRSIAFRREVWERVGGYPEHLDHAEDTAFVLAARSRGVPVRFAPDAFVEWRPRASAAGIFGQYFRYARGDGKAGHFPGYYGLRMVGAAALVAFVAVSWRDGPLAAGLRGAGLVVAWWLYFVGKVPARMRDGRHLLLSLPILLLCDLARIVGYVRGVGARALAAVSWRSR